MARRAQTILQTGNRGFTLVEVMVATCVLALGSVLIYEAFFISLDSYNYCSDYMKVSSWMDEKIWQAQADLSHFGTLLEAPMQGGFVKDNRRFSWDLSYSKIDKAESLFRLELLLSWQEGRRKIGLLRTAHALYKKEGQIWRPPAGESQ